MPLRASISVPAAILAEGRFAAAPVFAGTVRPSGAGLTGTDLQLWFTLLDLVGDGATLEIERRHLAAVLGRVHSDRLQAAMERLKGTDIIMPGFVAPLVVDHAVTDPARIMIKLDRRVVDIVTASRDAGTDIDVPVASLRELSARWSLALYGRFLAWQGKHYPADRAIGIKAHPRGRAFDLDVPVDLLPQIFAFDGQVRPFEIKNRFLTSSKLCPLQRELGRAGVAVDTALLADEISPGRIHGLRIRISEVTTKFADLRAAEKHRKLRFDHRQPASAPDP